MSATNTAKKPAKKQLIKIDWPGSDYSNTFSTLAFALVGTPKEGRKQVTSFATCREGLYGAVKTFFDCKDSGNSSNGTYKSSQGPIDTNKLRLLLHKDCGTQQNAAAYREKLFNAKNILNLYERAAGWSPSKITTVKHDEKEHVWLLTGPKEWMSSPHLLSMVMLIVRVTSKRGPFKVSTMAEIQGQWEKMVKARPSDSDVNTYLAKSYKFFPVLIKNYKKLFTDTLRVAYSDPNSRGFNSGGGIHSLCECNSVNKRLDEAVKALMAKK